MDTAYRPGAGRGRGPTRPPLAPAALTPVVARALELGRGPPGLARWARGTLGRPGPAPGVPAPAVRRLAGRLADLLRRPLGPAAGARIADDTVVPGRPATRSG